MTAPTAPTRIARLVLLDRDGAILGQMPDLRVSTPWWPDVGPVNAAVRERYGLEVIVLRLLEAELDSPPGGRVTYLAEIRDAELVSSRVSDLQSVDRATAEEALREDPRRMAWARPGGPSADLAWAVAALAAADRYPVGDPEQIRTWNLSSLWRLPTNRGPVWLKHVPAFMAHEGAVITALGDAPVPPLIATEAGRTLMDEIPGDDQYDAGAAILGAGVDLLVTLQARWATRVNELEALGLPDWRPSSLVPAIEDVVTRTAAELSTGELRSLERLVDGLPDRFADLTACGLPDTLVHGDFSPGNLRWDENRLVLLDWGDSGIGHPLFDQAAMLDRAPEATQAELEERWVDRWRIEVPDSDPQRAARLIGPIAACRQAVIYRMFLDRIEPSEHRYHRADPGLWLREAAKRVELGDGWSLRAATSSV